MMRKDVATRYVSGSCEFIPMFCQGPAESCDGFEEGYSWEVWGIS